MVEIKVTKKQFSRNKVLAAAAVSGTATAPPPTPETALSVADVDEYPEAAEKEEHYDAAADDTTVDEPHRDDDEFLADLSSTAFQRQLAAAAEEKVATAAATATAKISKKLPKPRAFAAAAPAVGDDDLFSDRGSPLLGRDRLVLLQKVKQYKALFPEKLKSFKIKKDPSATDLRSALEEMDVLVSVSSVDEFLTDSILSSIKIIEGVTANTKNYDVSGLSFMLKNNKNFHNLCKQLYIKYGCFANVPAEYQITMIVATSSYICMQKNRNKDKLNSFLDESIPVPNK